MQSEFTALHDLTNLKQDFEQTKIFSLDKYINKFDTFSKTPDTCAILNSKLNEEKLYDYLYKNTIYNGEPECQQLWTAVLDLLTQTFKQMPKLFIELCYFFLCV